METDVLSGHTFCLLSLTCGHRGRHGNGAVIFLALRPAAQPHVYLDQTGPHRDMDSAASSVLRQPVHRIQP